MKVKYFLKTVDDEGNPVRIEVSKNDAAAHNQDTMFKQRTHLNRIRRDAGFKVNLVIKEVNGKEVVELP